MSYIYNQVFRVPVWVVVKPGEAQQKVVDAFVNESAFLQLWPSKTFADTAKAMGRKGWNHVVGQKMPYTIDIPFICTAVAEHVKRTLGVSKLISGTPIRPYTMALSRTISSWDDYATLFDQVLSLEPELNLSQLFGVAERCHFPLTKTYVYVTPGPVQNEVVQRVAGEMFEVEAPARGEGENALKDEEYDQLLDQFCKETIEQVKQKVLDIAKLTKR